MSVNGSINIYCGSKVIPGNNTCEDKGISVTASLVSMTAGICSNSLALFILVKSYKRIRVKTRASFLLSASSLMVTDLLGHMITGSLVLYVYSSHKKWETFDPHHILCNLFGAFMVFFGLSPLFLGSVMAVERCIGVTKPIFHSTAISSHHMKRLVGLSWLLAALVALLPVLLKKPYEVQDPQSWCFYHMGEPKDWLDELLPVLFSVLGLKALLVSIVCNTLTSCALLQSRLHRKHQTRGPSYHIEMICQLLAIMLVSCICWGPLLIHLIILSTTDREPGSPNLLLVVRIATWNQILDPWVYILLRKAVLRKVFMLSYSSWGPKSHNLHQWQTNVLLSSGKTNQSGAGPDHCSFNKLPLTDTMIKSIT
ncbi:prostaglandin F2-alpha receptor-like [Sphaeramia orbicularis]|uniref:Thromboxane A2 receptor n=1 Tax=Sphaeramia orbicularis TaxID=375764 RepID=A0A672YG79_9TELE|nr:prostaglandin F2-alpha receptor-like [Sphaeramia orbicularis]